MTTRRIAAGVALMLGLMVSLGAVQSQAATLSPTTTIPAAAGLISVSSLTPTSAAFSAGFNPGSDGTTLRFQVFSGATQALASPWVSLAGGAPAAPVSYTATNLAPNTSYAVRLVWFDAALEQAVPLTGALTAFATPIEAAAVPSMVASTTQIWLGDSVTLTGSATANPLGALVDLESAAGATNATDATAAAGSFTPYLDGDDSPVFGTIGAGLGATTAFAEFPVRNTQFRLALPGTVSPAGGHLIQEPSVSRPVSVDVFPVGSVLTSRPGNGSTVKATANFAVQALTAGYRGEYVYFYDAPNSHSTGTLIGRDQLTRSSPNEDGITRISAHVTFKLTGGAYVHACVQHAILPDMGTPFTDAACGRPTLRSTSH